MTFVTNKTHGSSHFPEPEDMDIDHLLYLFAELAVKKSF